jgi:predicted metalloprotease
MSTYARTAAIAALLLAGALLVACGGYSAGATGTEPTQTPAPVSLEGRFAFEEMDEFLGAVEPLVARFFETRFPDSPPPRAIALVRQGEALGSPCGTHFQQAYEYCPANGSIFIGQELLFAFFRVGDAAPAVALAHEWAHHVQTVRRVSPPRTARESVAFENQADCVAGAWAAFADDQGWLELPDDLDDAGALMQAIGSREGRGRDHGTATERAAAFDLGLRDGVEACNAYSPRTPVA